MRRSPTSGLAKLCDTSEIARSVFARHHRFKAHVTACLLSATIAYMSPEQAGAKPLDARSDVFPFGVVMYELLAGQRPFVGASDLEVLQQILQNELHLPVLARAHMHIPLPLRGIVEKALEQDPADRYQSMREMVVDLRRVARQRRTR